MSRYKAMFEQLSKQDRGAFIPFLIAGDPCTADSLRYIQQVIDSGADALEIGLAFSDPTADGPVIQGRISKLIENNYSVAKSFDVIKAIRHDNPTIPIGLLVYINLVLAKGIDAFFAQCQTVGVDSVLIADLPVEHSQYFQSIAREYQVDLVFICPPNAGEDVITQVAKQSSGYTYLVSRNGVTGDQNSQVIDIEQRINQLEKQGAPPVILGFGISQPVHVQEAIKNGARGAIAGSAICRILENHENDREKCAEVLGTYVQLMKSATYNI
jgi:tryptophan synthase alpha chain